METSLFESLKACHICGCVEALTPTLTTVFDRRNLFSEQVGIFKKTEAWTSSLYIVVFKLLLPLLPGRPLPEVRYVWTFFLSQYSLMQTLESCCDFLKKKSCHLIFLFFLASRGKIPLSFLILVYTPKPQISKMCIKKIVFRRINKTKETNHRHKTERDQKSKQTNLIRAWNRRSWLPGLIFFFVHGLGEDTLL